MTGRGLLGLLLLVAVVATPLVEAVAGAVRPRDARLGDRTTCAAYDGIPEGWPRRPLAGMTRIAGGTYVPGSTRGYLEEKPSGPVHVDPFFLDRTEVTNAQFEAFVLETAYVTVAERSGHAPVFHVPAEAELAESSYAWWQDVAGASWRHPTGPGSDLRGKSAHPVVQVAYDDALAYASWLGRRLPTEAEWELAARAGRDDDTLHRAPKASGGTLLANFWQGAFPTVDTAEDGFAGAAPVGCFRANAFGLYDTIGNVWEWTGSAYRGSHRDAARSGPAQDDATVARVIKGGSFLCSSNFCARYRVSARHRQEPTMTGVHIGFRTAARPTAIRPDL